MHFAEVKKFLTFDIVPTAFRTACTFEDLESERFNLWFKTVFMHSSFTVMTVLCFSETMTWHPSVARAMQNSIILMHLKLHDAVTFISKMFKVSDYD